MGDGKRGNKSDRREASVVAVKEVIRRKERCLGESITAITVLNLFQFVKESLIGEGDVQQNFQKGGR